MEGFLAKHNSLNSTELLLMDTILLGSEYLRNTQQSQSFWVNGDTAEDLGRG